MLELGSPFQYFGQAECRFGFEPVVERRTSHIRIDEQDLVVGVRAEGQGQVDRDKGPAVAAIRTGDDDDLASVGHQGPKLAEPIGRGRFLPAEHHEFGSVDQRAFDQSRERNSRRQLGRRRSRSIGSDRPARRRSGARPRRKTGPRRCVFRFHPHIRPISA